MRTTLSEFGHFTRTFLEQPVTDPSGGLENPVAAAPLPLERPDCRPTVA
jgi:hypothetical protein